MTFRGENNPPSLAMHNTGNICLGNLDLWQYIICQFEQTLPHIGKSDRTATAIDHLYPIPVIQFFQLMEMADGVKHKSLAAATSEPCSRNAVRVFKWRISKHE